MKNIYLTIFLSFKTTIRIGRFSRELVGYATPSHGVVRADGYPRDPPRKVIVRGQEAQIQMIMASKAYWGG